MWTTHTTRPQHEPLRKLCLARDHYTCQACGYQDEPPGHNLEADHVRNLKLGGTQCLNNLQTLCKPCHRRKTQREARTALKARGPYRRYNPNQPVPLRAPVHPADALSQPQHYPSHQTTPPK